MYTHSFFEATPPGAAPGPPVKNRVPVFATSGGVINTFGVAVPTGDERKQAKKHRGGSGPPPYSPNGAQPSGGNGH